MANNNEKKKFTNSLKARFCRQYFPTMKLFLENFNISEGVTETKKYTYNSLGMHFLLDSYDEKNEKDRKMLKENCYWAINDVEDKDLLDAIEEFFYITEDTFGDKDNSVEKNSVEEKRNSLLENIFKLGLNNDEQSSIGDTTLRLIADYFGVRCGEDKMGNFYRPFLTFAKKAGFTEEDGIYRFSNALRLFSSVRNETAHTDQKYTDERLNLYHQFTMFVYIGYVYVCRRIWKKLENNSFSQEIVFNAKGKKGKEEEKSISREYKLSEKATNYISEPAEIEFDIDLGSNKLKKIVCKQEGEEDQVKESNPCIFKIKKYQTFDISIECEGNSHNFKDQLDYYSWYQRYKVFFPDNQMPIYEEGPQFSEAMNKMIDQVIKTVRECTNEELKKAISQELATITPVIQEIKDSDNTSKDKIIENISNVLGQLGSLNNDTSQAEMQINNLHKQIKELHKDIFKKYDDFSDSLYELTEKNKKIEEDIEILNRWERLFKSSIILLIFGIACISICYIIKEPIKANIIWLRHPIILSIVSIILIYGVFITPGKSWNPLKVCKEKGNTKWMASIGSIILIAASVASVVMLPFHSGRSLIDNYNFLGQDSTNNKYVARFLDDYLPYDEELTRTKLALYYTDIVGDLEKAEYYSAPMLDMEKFKTGSLVAMYVLYCRKEIPTLSNLLEKYKDTYGEDDPSYCELQGALLLDTLYGYRDVHKGTELLWKAYDAGSITACYNLGYLYSNDESTMEAIEQGRTIQNSNYDLPLAINFLKIACIEMPKASVLLGDIYSDLGMPDSAFYYYEKAMTETVEGNIFKYASYKHGVLTNIYGFKPNDGLLYSQSMKYAPAMMFSSIAMELDKNLFNQIGKDPYTKYFFLFFKNKDHKQAIRWFESAIKNGKELELKDLGVYQYIPPVVLDHIIIGEKEKALAVLQQYRSGSKFDMTFINAVELLLGSNLVERDSIKGMQLMHESAANGCLYSKMFCIYRDTEKSLKKNPSAFIDSKQLKEISKEIPFAHVIESLLLMRAGRTKDAEEAAHMALWKRHPAGAFAFEFMPNEYYEIFDERITNGIDNISKKDLYLLRKLQEMTLRSTSTMKDRSLLFTCILDKALHDKTKEDFSENFVFWSKVAVETDSHSSQIRLLRIYQDMIKEGYKDNQNIIDPLIRSVVFNMMRGDYNFAPEYINYILHFLKDRRLVSEGLYRNLLNSYGTKSLFKKLKSIEGTPNRVPATFHTTPFYFIDDFSIFTDFSYLTGMYTLFMKERGDNPSFVFNMSDEDYYSNWTK